MTHRIDWTLVGKPHWHLTLRESLTDSSLHFVEDQHGRKIFPASPLDTCIRFMRAFERKVENVTVDEAAISRALDKSAVRWAEAQAETLPLAPVIPLKRKDVA